MYAPMNYLKLNAKSIIMILGKKNQEKSMSPSQGTIIRDPVISTIIYDINSYNWKF